MPGYRDLYLDVDLEDLGDGLFVKLRNPVLMAESEMPPPPAHTDDDVERLRRAEQHGKDTLARLIVDWNIWDPTKPETETRLPLPKDDPSVMDRIPPAVLLRLMAVRANAQRKQTAIIEKLMEPKPANGTLPIEVPVPN